MTREELEHIEKNLAVRMGYRARLKAQYETAGKIADPVRRHWTLKELEDKMAANERDIHSFEQRRNGAERQGQASRQKTVWTGTARKFGEHVLGLYARGDIKATSRMDALNQWSERYVQKNGITPMNPRSILQSLANKRDMEGK